MADLESNNNNGLMKVINDNFRGFITGALTVGTLVFSYNSGFKYGTPIRTQDKPLMESYFIGDVNNDGHNDLLLKKNGIVIDTLKSGQYIGSDSLHYLNAKG